MNVNLKVRKPEFDKHHMIVFDSSGAPEDDEAPDYPVTWAYNAAIRHVMEKHNLRPFHQIGRDNKHGYHGWEVWARVTDAQMEALLPEIEAQVIENLKPW